MVAVTDRAGDGDRPAEGPAAVGRAGEPDAVAADPGHIDIVAVDGLLSLRVLARATLADLGNRPDVRPVPAAGGMPHSGSTGRRDGGRDRGCKCYTEDDQAPQNAPGMPAVNCPSNGRGGHGASSPPREPQNRDAGVAGPLLPGFDPATCAAPKWPSSGPEQRTLRAPGPHHWGRPPGAGRDVRLRGGAGGQGQSTGTPSWQARRKQETARRKEMWRGFAQQQPGTHCAANSSVQCRWPLRYQSVQCRWPCAASGPDQRARARSSCHATCASYCVTPVSSRYGPRRRCSRGGTSW